MDYLNIQNTKTRTVVKDCILKFCKEFKNNPFNFLYESSIQGRLYSLMYEELAALNESASFITSGKKLTIGGTQNVSLVQTEYPSEVRFDIAFIDKNRMIRNDEYSKKYKNELFWIQPVNIAIEIKYAQLGDKIDDKVLQLKNDISKIENYRTQKNYTSLNFLGIALLFIQTSPKIPLQIDASIKPIEQLNFLENNATIGYYI